MQDGDRHSADASGAGQTFRLKSDLPLDIEGDHVRGRHVLQAGETRLLRPFLGRGARLARRLRRGGGEDRRDDPLLAGLAQYRPDPGSPPEGSDPALRAGDQGPDLPADRAPPWPRSRPPYPRRQAGSATGTIAIRGSATRPSLCRRSTSSTSTGKPTSSWSSSRTRADRGRFAADHVRHRRPARPDRVDTGRPDRLRRGAARQDRKRSVRPAAERRLRRRPRLDPAAHAAQRAPAPPPLADRRSRRPSVPRRLARSGPGHLGGPREAAALRLLEARCAGSPSIARPSWPRSAATPSSREVARDRRRDPCGHRRARFQRTGSSASTTRRTPSTPPRSSPRSSASCPVTTSSCAVRGGDRRGPDRGRLRPPLQDRRDGRRPLRQGGHLPHLLLLARVCPRHRRRAAARARPDGAVATGRVAARPLRRGVRRRDRPAPRQLPAGLLAPRSHRGRGEDHRPRDAGEY